MSAIADIRSVDEQLGDLREGERRIDALVSDARHYMRENDDAVAADRCERIIELLVDMRDLVDRARAQLLRERDDARRELSGARQRINGGAGR